MVPDPLEPLRIADPELAGRVARRLQVKPARPAADELGLLVAETLWALSVEIAFGQAVATGYAEVAGELAAGRLERFRGLIRESGAAGPVRGRIMAECLPAVVKHAPEGLLARFDALWRVMERKGSHLLSEPLAQFGELLASGDTASAAPYLRLLEEVFSAELSYAEGRWFASALPAAARALPRPRRPAQLEALRRVVREDRRLAEPLLAGFDRGLALLSAPALADFVAEAVRKFRRSPPLGMRHLALESSEGRRGFAARQVRVGLPQVRGRLQRYLGARVGQGLAVRPLSSLPAAAARGVDPGAMVSSDRGAVYLAEEIGWHPRREENLRLYALLAALELSFHEFGTVDFDLEKAAPRLPPWTAAAPAAAESGAGDLARFLGVFPDEALAADLFCVFELARLRRCLERVYPGLARRAFPLLRQAAARQPSVGEGGALLNALLERLVLTPAGAAERGDGAAGPLAEAMSRGLDGREPVEASAELTARWFEPVAAALRPGGGGRLQAPFGWRPWPKPAMADPGPHASTAAALRAELARRGLHVFAGDIRRLLARNGGRLAAEDLRELCGAAVPQDFSAPGISGHSSTEGGPEGGARTDAAAGLRYPEWDANLGDYLPDHVLLREQPAAAGDGGFYAAVTQRRQGLIAATRRAFECLRPEGLVRLRPWGDGEELDLASLVAAAADRRAGNPAPERLYVKHVQGLRDVAVLVLVDVSRSTAHFAAGIGQTVLEVEKEAIVVLCEALDALGDAFAVAGFSGTGRLGVDYYPLKGFAEPLAAEAKARIGALRPQRNTRMGAAIRHAGSCLDRVRAKVRLLIVLGDGFPNDRDYKQEYAIADTRRALSELQARGIRTHALTVNMAADPRLDALYGRLRHHVISDVRELPGRLVRVYGTLTR